MGSKLSRHASLRACDVVIVEPHTLLIIIFLYNYYSENRNCQNTKHFNALQLKELPEAC